MVPSGRRKFAILYKRYWHPSAEHALQCTAVWDTWCSCEQDTNEFRALHLVLYVAGCRKHWLVNPVLKRLHWLPMRHSSWLCAICSQQVGCPWISIVLDLVPLWYRHYIWCFCPFLDVIRPHCSRSPPSSSTIYPSFHQQPLYPISSYYMSKILTFPFFDSI